MHKSVKFNYLIVLLDSLSSIKDFYLRIHHLLLRKEDVNLDGLYVLFYLEVFFDVSTMRLIFYRHQNILFKS
jgi:hypothetical protein